MKPAHRISVEVDASVKTYLACGLAVVFFIVGGIGVWAATTNIAGAVVGAGLIVVESNVKKVQHPTGAWARSGPRSWRRRWAHWA